MALIDPSGRKIESADVRHWYNEPLPCPKCRSLIHPIDALRRGLPFVFAFQTATFMCVGCGHVIIIQVKAVVPNQQTPS